MKNVKNLYFKSWFLTEVAIEARLTDSPLQWKRIGLQFFFIVTPGSYEEVLNAIAPLNRDNGSMINESDIDYVYGTPEEIAHQLKQLYGDIVVLSQPSSH